MRFKGSSLPGIIIISLLVFITTEVSADRRVRTGGTKDSVKKADVDIDKTTKDKRKPFSELIKDKVKIEGLFTFYKDTTTNDMLLEIKPDQMGPIYLCSETRSQSEGAFFDNGSMSRTFPFYFIQVGENVMFMEKNLRFRADTSSTLHKAVTSGISDHLFASTEIKSKPHDSTKAILIDPAEFFIRDAQNIAYLLGNTAKTGISFDKKNSYFGLIKSFPENSEIDVKLHYKTSKPITATTMQNPYSLFHTYHYSLSTLPETDYVPRLADDRVGYFMTLYQDYSNLDTETPYVRYIQRWHLKKKYPDSALSEPVEPIVFWAENTVPEEYRSAVKEGIEFWNKSFEKIGFKNAIVARQMPDDADWDPADIRYNTIRWIIIPGATYAVGPSRANPFTGQIYDADVRFSTDWIRAMYNTVEYYIKPVSFDGEFIEEENLLDLYPHEEGFCNYPAHAAQDAAFGLAYALSVSDDLVDKDSLTHEYVHAYLVETIAHEVGHTLGLRHNFKASTVYNLEQINNPEFTRKHSSVGTIMDYNPVNLAGPDEKQGEFYTSVPGPYDDWVIEYGYSDFGAGNPEEELPALKEIAGRAAEPALVYGTDEDAFGYSTKSIDPYCNLFDLGDDPLAYSEHILKLTDELWKNSLDDFEKPGESYQKVLRAFQSGWRAYYTSIFLATKYIGGIHHNNLHVGDKEGNIPFQPVSASEQRRAMTFLQEKIFAPDAFDLPADLLNKLQPERFPDFNWSVYSVYQVDYPIHAVVLAYQNLALSRLYSAHILGRLVNNLERYQTGEDRYTMYDMFKDVRNSIWSEMDTPKNINSFRRQLQLIHLKRLIAIYLSNTVTYPSDARTLAGNDLDILERKAQQALKATSIDNITKAHFKEVLRQIESAKGAKRDYTKM